ncbi:MAG: hypothetical protein HY720_10325, partial [Planctomycetes bacterium]|nr:hypothetical protein [Planctomycetota bacterium]
GGGGEGRGGEDWPASQEILSEIDHFERPEQAFLERVAHLEGEASHADFGQRVGVKTILEAQGLLLLADEAAEQDQMIGARVHPALLDLSRALEKIDLTGEDVAVLEDLRAWLRVPDESLLPVLAAPMASWERDLEVVLGAGAGGASGGGARPAIVHLERRAPVPLPMAAAERVPPEVFYPPLSIVLEGEEGGKEPGGIAFKVHLTTDWVLVLEINPDQEDATVNLGPHLAVREHGRFVLRIEAKTIPERIETLRLPLVVGLLDGRVFFVHG